MRSVCASRLSGEVVLKRACTGASLQNSRVIKKKKSGGVCNRGGDGEVVNVRVIDGG